jgi:hypothetical protein
MKFCVMSLMLLLTNVSNAYTVGIPVGVGSWTSADGKELFAVYFDSSDLSTVDCNTKDRYVVTTDNKAYKTIVAVILTHYASQKSLRVKGAGSCEAQFNSETLSWALSGDQPF